MAKKKKKAVYLTPEQQLEADYQKAIRRMNGADKMYQAKDRVQMYRQAIKMFQSLGNYGESEVYKKWCKKCLPKAREQYRQEVYQTGVHIKENAKTAMDYEEAIEEFLKIKREYKDIPQQIAECRRLKQKAEKNEKNKGMLKKLVTLAILAGVVGGVLFLRTPAAFYQEGSLLMRIKDYERASTMFARSIGYKDTQEKRRECDYQRAVSSAQNGDDKKALSILDVRVGDYKDALQIKAGVERKILSESSVGDTVVFGTDKWIVAKAVDGMALLVRKKPVEADVAYLASGRAASWEQSDIRHWLNGQFFEENFSVYEQEAIQQTDVKTSANSVYGTDGGAATRDYVFLLSEQEARQYQGLLAGKEAQREWWLRTPGNAPESAMFVSAKGEIMHYGYAVGSKDIALRPAIWVAL